MNDSKDIQKCYVKLRKDLMKRGSKIKGEARRVKGDGRSKQEKNVTDQSRWKVEKRIKRQV